MIQEIAKITGLKYDIADRDAMLLLQRIAQKLPRHSYLIRPSLTNPDFINMVKQAKLAVENEPIVEDSPEAPKEKRLKIKSSPKGERCKVVAPNGIRYSYGPIWNESVKKGKGIAVAAANIEKLRFQAVMLGVKKAENMDAGQLCAAIVATGKI